MSKWKSMGTKKRGRRKGMSYGGSSKRTSKKKLKDLKGY